MAIRTGLDYHERLRDGRSIYVNGERVKDVTTYPAFTRTVQTIASLYDLQHEAGNLPLLTYPSPKTGQPVSLSFLRVGSVEDVTRLMRAEEIRAEATFGLMGRMPDFMNALGHRCCRSSAQFRSTGDPFRRKCRSLLRRVQRTRPLSDSYPHRSSDRSFRGTGRAGRPRCNSTLRTRDRSRDRSSRSPHALNAGTVRR